MVTNDWQEMEQFGHRFEVVGREEAGDDRDPAF